MSGWIAIKRGALEHELFIPDGKFSRFEAWVWLIEHAAFRDTAIDLHGERIIVPRGALCYSLRALASEWKWSVKAVRSFLSALVRHRSISLNTEKKGHSKGTTRTIITICNYEKYQSADQHSGTRGAQEGHTKEQVYTLPKGRDASASVVSDADLFRIGKSILGARSGGQIAKLKQHFGIPRAKEILADAASKENAAEWVAAVLKRSDPAAEKLKAWGIGDAEPVRFEQGAWDRSSEEGAGSADVPRVQSHATGEEPEDPLPFGDDDDGRFGDLLSPLRPLGGVAL